MTVPRPLSRDHKGRLCHAFIGRMVRSGVRDPDLVQIRDLVSSDPTLRGLPPTYARILAGDLTMAGMQYAKHFAPPADWLLLGTEIRLGSAVADLVWRDSGGMVWIDEVKSGVAPLASRERLEAQVQRLSRGGHEVFGHAFRGVRVCTLKSPNGAWVHMPTSHSGGINGR